MKKSMTLTAALVTSAVVVSLMAVHFLVSRTGEEKQQKGEQLAAMRIHDAFVAKIIEPVIVANAMSGDRFLLDALAMESPDHEAEDVARVQTYLQGLKKTFSYSSVCLISHKTRRYYYDGGLLKVIDPAHDPGDLWYGHLVAGQKRWRTAIFREKDAEHSTMYINVVIKDSQGKVLGVVSTGICLKDMLDFISRYEQRYKVKINLVDETGLVKLDSDYVDIEVASLAYLVLPLGQDDTEFHYMRTGITSYAVVKFIDELGWYFVVRADRGMSLFSADKIFYLVAVLLLALAVSLLYYFNRRLYRVKVSFPGKASHVDKLTGLPNRNFFKDMYGERGVFNTTRYHCLAVFDIDFFKEANDSMNGDDALLSVVNHAQRLLDGRGMVLRWGGDEFLELFELPMESAYSLCRQFCRNVAADGLVTVSVGLTEVRIADTIKKNYYRAAQLCYQVKEMGGNGVKKD